MIGVIDYKAGNLMSVCNALSSLKAEFQILDSAERISEMGKIIFPGVGAFGKAMENLREQGMDSAIKEFIERGKPFLGICLGMQLLFGSSEENKGVDGLGVVKGEVVKFQEGKVPQIGWNKIENTKGKLFEGVESGFAYFANSYYCVPEESRVVSAQTEYIVKFCSALERGNVFALQFHPEKSSGFGLKVLENFVKIEVKK